MLSASYVPSCGIRGDSEIADPRAIHNFSESANESSSKDGR